VFRRRREPRAPVPDGSSFTLSNYYGWFWLGLSCHVLITWLASGQSSSAGWYLACMVLPESVLLLTGQCRWVPAKWWTRAPALLCVPFVRLDLYGRLFVLIPYYTGQIFHRAAGPAVMSFHLPVLAGGQFREILHRLTMNRPSIMTESYFVLVLGLYVLAAAAVIGLAGLRAVRRD
jgi:hypothetical protein